MGCFSDVLACQDVKGREAVRKNEAPGSDV